MEIRFTVFASGPTIINNYIIYQAAETTAPGTVVKSAVDPPPQTFPRPVFLANVKPVPHIVKVYSSPDGVTLGTLLSEFMYDPSFANVEIRPNIFLVVGRGEPYDPDEGETFIGPIDGSNPAFPDISGWDWAVELRSLGGKLRPDEYTVNGSNDGFTYPSGFYGEFTETIIITFAPKITTVSPIFNSMDVFSGYKRITASATVDVTWYNAYVDLVFAANTGFVQLQPLADVPENRQLTMYNMNGNQEQLTIRAAAGEVIQWMGENLTEIYIGKGESVWLYKRTDPDTSESFWHVAKELEGMQRVGSRFSADTGVKEASVIRNAVALDGRAMPTAQWPRIRWYVNKFPVGLLIPIAERNAEPTKRGFWAFDADNIYVPDARGYHERMIPGPRGNDSGRTGDSTSGTYDVSVIKDHRHLTVSTPGITGGGTPPPLTGNESIADGYVKTSGSGIESYVLVPQAAEPTKGRTSLSISGRGPGIPQNENTVINIGVVKLVWL